MKHIDMHMRCSSGPLLRTGVRAATWLLALTLAPVLAHANALSDAWNCAKANVEAQYLLLSKGTKAMQVLGSSPQCVAQALVPDVPLLGISGTMVAINAIDAQLLPANSQCQPKLKSTAVQPVGKILDAMAGNLIPGPLLSAATTEAQNQLWTFLTTTPPFSEITSRAECGCTFLEAGISVETVKEVLSAIGKTGKACDQLLNNVPGYAAIKSAVSAGAYELNNALEGVLTDQTQHKAPQDYYLYDFDGHPRSGDFDSHAVQMLLNPSHDPATQSGATLRFDRFVKSGGGAQNRNQLRDVCVQYFDEHTMSPSNANKVCNGFVAQFKADVTRRSARIKAINSLLQALPAQVSPLLAEAQTRCTQVWTAQFSAGQVGDQIVQCRNRFTGYAGGIDLINPYSSITDSFGIPLSKQEIDDTLLKGTSVVYFGADYQPQAMTGVYRMAYDVLMSRNLDDPAQAAHAVTDALATARTAARMQLDTVIAEETERANVAFTKKQAEAVQDTLKRFAADVTTTTLAKCPSLIVDQCQWQLFQAWQMCDIKATPLVFTGDFPSAAEQKRIDAVRAKCAVGYTQLVNAINDWTNNVVAEYGFASGICTNGASPAQATACSQDNLTSALTCWGGLPALEASYLTDGKLRQKPDPLSDCGGIYDSFAGKWQIDGDELQRLATATQQARNLCAQLPANSAPRTSCDTRVTQASDKCSAHIRSSYDLLVPTQKLYSGALSQAVMKFKGTANRCQQRVVDQAQSELNRQAAPLKAVQLYADLCPPANATGDWAATCKTAIANAVHQCLNPSASTTSSGNLQIQLPGSLGGVSLPTNLKANTFTLAGGLSLSAKVDSVQASIAEVLSLPVGALEFNIPASIDSRLYSADQLVAGCKTSVDEAIARVRRDYVAAWPLVWPDTADASRNTLAARGIGCTAAAVSRGYAFTCDAGRPLESCQVLLNARAPGVASCTVTVPVTQPDPVPSPPVCTSRVCR